MTRTEASNYKESGFPDVSVGFENNRLVFNTLGDFQHFLNIMEKDYTSDNPFEDGDHTNLYANDFLDIITQEFPGFISKRTSIVNIAREMSAAGNIPSEDNDPTNDPYFQDEPVLASIINDKLEFQVGDTIFKFYDDFLQYKLYNDGKEEHAELINQDILLSDIVEGVEVITVNGPLGGHSTVYANSSTGGDDACSITFSYSIDPTNPRKLNFHSNIAGAYQDILWDFGNGATNTSQRHPTYTYPADGQYQVTLTVSGSEWSSSSTCGGPGVRVRNVSIGCSPNFSHHHRYAKTFLFQDQSVVPGLGSYMVEYDMDSDGDIDISTNNGESFYWQFGISSTYTVTQKITTFCGTSISTSQVVVPNIASAGSQAGQCYGAKKHEHNPSNYAADRKWKAQFKVVNNFLSGNKLKCYVKAMKKTVFGFWVVDNNTPVKMGIVGDFWLDCNTTNGSKDCSILHSLNRQIINQNYAAGNMNYVWNSNDQNDNTTWVQGCSVTVSSLGKPVRLKDNSIRADFEVAINNSHTQKWNLNLH